MKKRRNGELRVLLEAGAAATSDDCIRVGWKTRPRYEIGGREMTASRAVWRLAHGDPGALNVLHRCGDEQCVNVTHLYLGTISENARDTMLMSRCGNQVVSWNLAQEIARKYRPGKAGNGNGNIAALSAEYGVSYAAIRAAARRVGRHIQEGITQS